MFKIPFSFFAFFVFGIGFLTFSLSVEQENLSNRSGVKGIKPTKFLGDLIKWIHETYYFNNQRAKDSIQVAGLISEITNVFNLMKVEVAQKLINLEDEFRNSLTLVINEMRQELDMDLKPRILSLIKELEPEINTCLLKVDLLNGSSISEGKVKLDPKQELEIARLNYKMALRRVGMRQESEVLIPIGGSCLRKGTPILLSNGGEKPVEDLKVGDLLVDHQLKPTKVLGVSSEFLLGQTFHGFDNKSFFFTDSHLLAGPAKGKNGSVQFYVQDKQRLLLQNPLMKFLPVDKMPGDHFDILQYNKVNKNVSSKSVKVFKDPMVHPMDTMVYFIQVDSPSGTYFANGFVCRHEIPPMEFWPNTMAVLFSVLSNSNLNRIKNIPYTLTSLSTLYEIVLDVQVKVEETLRFYNVQDLNSEEPKMEVDRENYELVINEIFNNPSFSAFGMGLYANVGPVLSRYLDNCDNKIICVPTEYRGSLQNLMRRVMLERIIKSFPSELN